METKIVELVIQDENQELAIDAISLVTSPAIEQDFVFFGKEKNNLTFAKVDEEKRMLISPALIPNKHIFRHNPNTQQDYYVYFSKETVRQASELYLKHNNHHKATYQHQDRVSGVLTIESWIKEGDMDKSKMYGFDLPNGTWFVKMKIENDDLWKKIKGGELKGISIEGYFTDKMEMMTEKKTQDEEILIALNEIINSKVNLGLTDDLDKIVITASEDIKEIKRDLGFIAETEKYEIRDMKLVDKRNTAYEKADETYTKYYRLLDTANDKRNTAEREANEAIKSLKGQRESIVFIEKRLDKTKSKATKTKNNLEKKINKIRKAAKDLGLDIKTTKADKALSQLTTLL